MSFTTSDLIVETLERAGVRRVHGLPGDSLNGLTDALRRNGTVAWEHVRHEEAAAFPAAADAAGALRAAFDHDGAALVDDLSAHLVFGLTTSATFAALTRRGS